MHGGLPSAAEPSWKLSATTKEFHPGENLLFLREISYIGSWAGRN